jgi:guanylate kinase
MTTRDATLVGPPDLPLASKLTVFGHMNSDLRSRVSYSGLVLSGLLGVGKTTLARRIANEVGLSIVPTVATRPVGTDETEFVRVTAEEFERRTLAREVVLPLFFGGNWYGYSRADWERASTVGGAGYIFNVRPQVGLAIAAILDRVHPVWVRVDETTRIARLRSRAAARDFIDARSPEADKADSVYAPLFPNYVDANRSEAAFEQLVLLARTWPCPS